MDLNVAWESPYETGPEHIAWFEDRAASVEYLLTWVPGSPSVRPRICAFPGSKLPEGVEPGDVLVAMDAALMRGGYRSFA